MGGREVTRFKREGEQYDVIVQMEPKDRSTPQDLGVVYVRGADGDLTPLSNLIAIEETVAPKELNHFNRQRAAIISANIAPGYTLGDALAFMDQAAKETLPANFQTTLDGQSREFRESGETLLVTFGLALVFIYLVLTAQFESFRGPLVIMLTVPLAMTGALLALKLTGGTLNVYSQIGLVMLVGLITKHGILIVEFANQQRARGLAPLDAVREAAVARFRPVLMTAITTIVGSIPMAMGGVEGAELRRPLALTVIAGLSVATVLTLVIIPVVYDLFAPARSTKYQKDEEAEG
jgi:multidrug efflux pump